MPKNLTSNYKGDISNDGNYKGDISTFGNYKVGTVQVR